MTETTGKTRSSSVDGVDVVGFRVDIDTHTVVLKPSYASVLTAGSQQRGTLALFVVEKAIEQDSAQKALKSVATDIDSRSKQIESTVGSVVARLRDCPTNVSRAELEVLCVQLETVQTTCGSITKLCTALTTAIDCLKGENENLKAALIAARARITRLESDLMGMRMELAGARKRVLAVEQKTDDQASRISKLEGNLLSRDIAFRAKDYLGLFQEGLTFGKLVDVDSSRTSAKLRTLIDYIETKFSCAAASRFVRRVSSRVRCKNAIKNIEKAELIQAHVLDADAGNLRCDDIRKELVDDNLKAFELLCEMINITGYSNAQFPFEVRSGDGCISFDLRTYGEYPLWRHFGEHENCRACTLINEYWTANKLTGWPST